MNMRNVLECGWPGALLEMRGNHVLAYYDDKLVADIASYERASWAFFWYGSNRCGYGNIPLALSRWCDVLSLRGWTGVVKGGNPLLELRDPKLEMRDFDLVRPDNLETLRREVKDWASDTFPNSIVVDVVLYAGVAWHHLTKGRDGLGVRDIDVNIFFAEGGPINPRRARNIKMKWNDKLRDVDIWWNVLRPKQTPRDYIWSKIEKAKEGRWLTMAERPMISLNTGETLWKGRCVK